MIEAEVKGVIHEFPDGMSQEEIRDVLRKKYPPQQPQSVSNETQQEDSGVFRKVMQRGKNIQDVQEMRRRGQISYPEEVIRGAGQFAGAIGDVSGAALSGLASGADYLTGGNLSKGASSVLGAVGSLPVIGGGTIGERLPGEMAFLSKKYGQAKEAAPRSIAIAEALGNLATVIPSFASYSDDLARGARIINKTEVPPSEVVKKAASALFDQADQAGGALSPSFMVNMTGGVIGKIEPDQMIKRVKAIGGATDPYENVAEILMDYTTDPLTLKRAQSLDEVLGAKAFSNVDAFGNITDEGRKYLDIQHSLRDAIESAPDTAFIGGKEGFEKTKQARKLWSASMRMRDVERIIENAERFPNTKQAIQSGFRTLLRNKKRLKGFNKKQIAAMEKAARTGLASEALNFLGSGLVPIFTGIAGGVTGGASGMLAALPAYAIQQVSRGAAGSIQAKKALDVLKKTAPKEMLSTRPGRLSTIGKASIPAGVASLTKEELSEIAKMPPDKARRALQGKRMEMR